MIIAGTIGLFVALPFFLGDYRLGALITILIYVVVAVSYRLLVTTGEYSFAHVIVMGIGGYTSGLLARYYGLPFWATLPLGGLVAAGFAAATARPLFRMKGFYFFIGSFAMGEAVRVSWIRWKVPFGGPGGLWYIPSPTAGPITFDTTFSYYWLTLGIAAACLFLLYRIDQSRIGKTLMAIHSQDSLCESLGINILRYKALAYITASFFTGIGGVLLTHSMGMVSPPQFSLTMMIYVLVWVVVGGSKTFWGPIAGVFTFRLIEEQLRGILLAWMPMVYGSILIAIVLFLPEGLESVPRRIREWRRAREG